MRRMLFVLYAVIVLTTAAFARVHYITHVAGSSAWETNLILTNTSEDTSTQAHVELLNADGEITLSYTVTMAGGATTTLPLQGHGAAAGMVTCASDFLTARVGYVASAATGGGTAEFRLSTELSASEILDLSNYYDQLTWAGFAVFNGTDEDVTVTPRYITSDLTSYTGTPFTLEAREKRVDYFENELGEPFANLNAVIFETDTPALTAIMISGKENEKLLFTRSTPYSDGWQVVDTYEELGFGDYFHLVGQAVVGNRVFYLVAADAFGYPFRNRLRSFNKWNGEYETTTDFGSNFEAKGIVASTDNSSVYVYGIEDYYETGPYYYIYRFRQSDGALVNERRLGPLEELSPGSFKCNIVAATTGDTVAVASQRGNDELVRVILSYDLDTVITYSIWTTDAILSDLFAHDGEYHMFRTIYEESQERYCTIGYYHFPYDDVTGGGTQHTFTGTCSGSAGHVLAGGGAVEGDNVTFMMKIRCSESTTSLTEYSADLRYVVIPSDSPGTWNEYLETDLPTTMGARMHIFLAGSTPHYCISTDKFSWILSRGQSFVQAAGERVVNPHVEGNHLYIVSCRTGRVAGLANKLHTVRVRKMKFLDFMSATGP